MKRLVTQFDDRRTRATVATPTCCCCCCCVASIVTPTAVTVLNAHQLVGQTEMPETKRWIYRIVAFLVLPLAVLAGIATGLVISPVDSGGAPWMGLLVGVAVWLALLLGLYGQLGLESGRAVAIVAMTVGLGGVVAFLIEFSVGLGIYVLSYDYGDDDGFPWGYLPLGLTFSLLAVWLLRKWMASLLRSTPP